MVNKPNELWGGNDLRDLKKLVNQIDKDMIEVKAEVTSLKENTSLAALIKANKRIAAAAERIAAALEKPAVDYQKLIEQVKANNQGITEAQTDGKETRQTKES